MSLMKAPENTSVWVDTARCKACDICVAVCPSGVLSMKQEPTSTLGAMISIEYPVWTGWKCYFRCHSGS